MGINEWLLKVTKDAIKKNLISSISVEEIKQDMEIPVIVGARLDDLKSLSSRLLDMMQKLNASGKTTFIKVVLFKEGGESEVKNILDFNMLIHSSEWGNFIDSLKECYIITYRSRIELISSLKKEKRFGDVVKDAKSVSEITLNDL